MRAHRWRCSPRPSAFRHASSSVNQVAGLPGPGALVQPTLIFRSGANSATASSIRRDLRSTDGLGLHRPVRDQLPMSGRRTCGDNPSISRTSSATAQTTRCVRAPARDLHLRRVLRQRHDRSRRAVRRHRRRPCPGNCQPPAMPTCGDDVKNQGASNATAATIKLPGRVPAGCMCGPSAVTESRTAPSSATAPIPAAPRYLPANCTCSPICGNACASRRALRPDGRRPVSGRVSLRLHLPADRLAVLRGEAGRRSRYRLDRTSHTSASRPARRSPRDLRLRQRDDFDCSFFANVGSFCSGDPSARVPRARSAPSPERQINTYGAPLPLSSGGVPVCVVNRFAGDVTGTFNLQTVTRRSACR